MTESISHYDILGVKQDASPEEIKTAYRRAARANHPDSGQPGAGALFPLVQKAWEVLGNEEKRKNYDHFFNRPPEPVQQQRQENPPQSFQSRPRESNVDREPRRNQAQERPTQSPFRPQFEEDSRAREERERAAFETRQMQQSESDKQASKLAKIPRVGWIKIACSIALWLLWVAVSLFIVKGVAKDGLIFALVAFFLTLGLTYLLMKFAKTMDAAPVFIFNAVVLPIPLVGLFTGGVTSTTLIFIVALVGMSASFGDRFLRQEVVNSARNNASYQHRQQGFQ